MKMTWKCANTLMDTLACVCISANGGVPKAGLSNSQLEKAQQYAKQKFTEIIGEWEDLFGEGWEIEEEKEEKKTFWIFREYYAGNYALFESEEEADKFRRNLDIKFLQDGGETMALDEWEIAEVELNPDLDEWLEED